MSKYLYPIYKLKTKSYIRWWLYNYLGKKILPEGYTQLDYIESTGTQYINTGINPTANTGVDIKATLTKENNSDKILFGSRARDARFWLDFDGTSSANHKILSGFGYYYETGFYELNTIYDISFNYNGNKKTIINNNDYTIGATTVDFTNSVPIYLFRANYSSALAGSFKIYACKIYKGTKVVRNFIPCKNSSNIVGMYDLVTKTFFENAGTGDFIAGDVSI